MRRSKGRANAALGAMIATCCIWGLSYISTKYLLRSLSPIQIASGRFVVASLLLGILSAASAGRRGTRARGRAWPWARAWAVLDSPSDLARAALAGVIGIPVYFLFEINALTYASAGLVSLAVSTIPVFNILAEAVVWRRWPKRMQLAGIVGSVAGAAWLVSLAGSSGGQGAAVGGARASAVAAAVAASRSVPVGIGLGFGAACSWVVYTMINRPLLGRYRALDLNAVETLVGSVVLVVAAAVSSAARSLQGLGDPGVLLNVLFLGVVSSALAYYLYLFALSHLGSAVATSFLNTVPVFAAVGGVLMLGETFTVQQAAAGAVVLASVSLVTAFR